MKFIKRALQLCLLSLTLCTIGLFTAATAPAATYYIDYGAGSNSNNGLSQGAAWKTHPYMNHGGSCDSGGPSYPTHTAGDKFIFKGGSTWPAACFTFYITTGGTSGAQDYYGVCVSNADFAAEPFLSNKAINDSPCATTTSWPSSGWTRPQFNLGGLTPASTPYGAVKVIECYQESSTVCVYTTFDNFEISNWDTGVNGGGDAPAGEALDLNSAESSIAAGTLLENSYIHDWVSNGNWVSPGGSQPVTYGVLGGIAHIRYTTISDASGHYKLNGVTYNHAFMGGPEGCGEFGPGNVVHDGWMGTSSCNSVHDSEFYNITQGSEIPYVGGNWQIHSHIIYDDGGFQSMFSVYNNAVHDSNAGLNVWGWYGTAIYNNVFWNLTNNYAIRTTTCSFIYPCGDSSGIVGYVVNNTIFGGGCYDSEANSGSNPTGLGTLYFENNICIAGSGGFSNITTIHTGGPGSGSYAMGSSEATTYGFTAANKYAPTTSDPSTAGVGTNLSGSCSGNLSALCSDTRGAPWFGGSYILRPTGSTAWDLGAYQGLGGTSSPPVVVFTSPTAGSHTGVLTLTVTATPQGSATITSCQFTIDGFTFGLPITTSPYTATWDTNTASNARAHTLGASCTDSNTLTGNASTVAVTPANVHLHNGWVSDSLWAPDITNVSFPAHSQTSGTSIYSYCVTPYTVANNDTETGFSQNLPTTYGDFAVILAIRNGGFIQVYNGTGGVGYTTDAGATAYPVTANVTYCFQLSVNMTAKNFTVIETSPNAVTIAGGTTPYGFRNTSTTSINYLSAYATSDSTPDTVEVSKFPPPPTNLIITNEQ